MKAQVFISPVDGVDPLGLIPEFCITPGEYLNYGIPTLHIEGGYDSIPGEPRGFRAIHLNLVVQAGDLGLQVSWIKIRWLEVFPYD